MSAESVRIGQFDLTVVSGGMLRGDGGTMFGIIPRTLWQRSCPPDEHNRILMDTNCLLVRTGDSTGLIDTGYGDKAPEKVRRRSCMEEGAPLLRNLAARGVAPAEVDWVILTHLHFDHAGGVTTRDNDGQLQPVFLNAQHYVQQLEWEDALSGRPELAGAYAPADIEPLHDAGLLTLVSEDQELLPGISVRRTDGHTRGHQLVTLRSDGQTAVYVGDVCPLVSHLRSVWSMAYDQYPLTTRRTKPEILGRIADEGHIAILSHDHHQPIIRLQRDDHAEFLARPLDQAE